MPTLNEYYGDYTGDVVFVKDQGYMTKREQQAQIDKKKEQQRRAKDLARVQTAVPTAVGTATIPIPVTPAPTAPTTPAETPAETPAGTPPPWWIPTAYTNPNEQQAFANAANAILPTLSPEDQRTLANYLSTNFKDVYGGYASAAFAPIPTKLGDERSQYLNASRAQAALGLLDKTQQAAGGTPAAGYDFLKNALNLIGQYSGTGPMTREQYLQFSNAVKELTNNAGKDMSAYSNLAQMFNLPGFTAGALVSNAPTSRLNE